MMLKRNKQGAKKTSVRRIHFMKSQPLRPVALKDSVIYRQKTAIRVGAGDQGSLERSLEIYTRLYTHKYAEQPEDLHWHQRSNRFYSSASSSLKHATTASDIQTNLHFYAQPHIQTRIVGSIIKLIWKLRKISLTKSLDKTRASHKPARRMCVSRVSFIILMATAPALGPHTTYENTSR